jgi:hypothetical protein
MPIHHFKGVDGASHTTYTPKQAKAVKMAKGKKHKLSVDLTEVELYQMKKIAGIRQASPDHIVKAFITKILNLK